MSWDILASDNPNFCKEGDDCPAGDATNDSMEYLRVGHGGLEDACPTVEAVLPS